MLDLARLGMEVDSSDVRKAGGDLDRFAKQGKRAEGAAAGVTRSTNLMAAGMKRAAVAIAATVGGVAAIRGGVRTLANFERQMSTVGAVSRATAGELQAMRDIATNLGSTTEFTATEVGEGLEFLARAGFTASESISAIPAVLDLATASAMGLGQAADISSNIMSAFGIAATDASSVADILAAASSRANTDVMQLGDAMAYVGPVASALGIEMSDTAAAIGVLSDAGIQGSSAGTGLRRVLSTLSNPTKDAEKAMSALGVSLADVNPQTTELTEIIDRLSGAGLSAADALKIFGDRGGPAILALTSQTGRLRELTGELSNVEGEAKRMAEYLRDNLGGDIDSLFSSIQGLVIALGEAGLTAVIRVVIQALTGLVRGITKIVDAIGAGIDAIGDFTSAILGIKTAEEIREAAIDNVTIAMGDQMRATSELNRMIREGLPSSVAVIEAKIEEARARRANVQELIAERQELELAERGYFDLVERIGETRRALDAMRTPGNDLEQMPANIRASFEETERALVTMLNRQQEMLASVRSGNFLREEEQAHLDEIEDNLDALRALMAELTGETAENVRLTERLSSLSGQIDMSNAIQGAIKLKDELGVSLQHAMGIMGLLGGGVPKDVDVYDPRDPRYDSAEFRKERVRRTMDSGSLYESDSFDYDALFTRLGSQSTRGGGGSKALNEMTEAARQAQQILGQVNRESVTYADIVNELTTALNAGTISQDQFNQALEIASGKFDDIEGKADRWASNMSGHFDGLITGGKKFSDVLKGIARQLESSAWQSLLGGGGLFSGGGVVGGKKGLFGGGGLFGGAIIPGILHSGGVAGRDGYGHGRVFSPSVFAGAQRYHDGGVAGLRPNEVPAILERGERVIPNGAGGGRVSGQAVLRIEAPEGFTAQQVGRIEGIAVEVVSDGLSQFARKALPTQIRRANDDPQVTQR